MYLCSNSKALHLQTVDTNIAKELTTAFGNIRNLASKITADAGKNINLSKKLFVDTSNNGFSQDDLTVFKEA